MSDSKKGIPLSEERKEQFRISRLNIKQKRGPKNGTLLSEEHKENIGKANAGKILGPLSDETKFKLSESLKGKNLGKKRTEETKLKMRIAKLGRKLSVETREKMRLAKIGKEKTDEHKTNLKAAWIIRKEKGVLYNGCI
jgi:hypothetical protein